MQSILALVPFVQPLSLVHVTLGLFQLSMASVTMITLWVSSFLCILNIVLAIIFRRNSRKELFSYSIAFVVELFIFVFALLFHMGVITSVPYHLPQGLSFNRAEIGATIAIALGLFPAAYWHHTTLSELNTRMAQDAKVLKEHDGGVRIRKSGPGEWMN